jgi:dTDP-4-dehydrorhamnose reductase
MQITIIGATGLIGKRLKENLIKRGNLVTTLSIRPTNIGFNCDFIRAEIYRLSPDIVVNCAALIGMRQCKEQPELASAVNAELPKILAKIAAELSIPVVQISTDAVFAESDGKNLPTETATPDPQTVYGKTKFEGEKHVLNYKSGKIFRLAKVVDGERQVFATLINCVRQKKQVRVSVDAISTPADSASIVESIANEMEKFCQGQSLCQIFHVTGDTYINMFELLIRLVGPKFSSFVLPVNEDYFGTKSVDESFVRGGLETTAIAPIPLATTIKNIQRVLNGE